MVLLSGCVKRADFDALTNRVTVLEASLPEIQEQIDALQSSISSLDGLSKGLQSSIEELKSADQGIGERISNLQSELQGKIDALDTRLSGDVSDLKSATKENADDIASLLSSVGAIEGNLEKLGDTYATDAELKVAVDELKEAIEQVKTDLTKTLGDSFSEALKGYATTAALKEVQDELGKIDLDKVKTDYEKAINDALDAALENNGQITKKVKEMISTALQSLEKRLAAVEGQVKGLLNRIQSVVFVPEYNDGKATINYGKVGTGVIEAQSKLTFQVYPAECAKAFNAEGAEKLLSFCFKDVQSRAAGERRLEIVKVEADATTGMIDVYANARDFAAGFYNDTPAVHYAVSLVVDDTKEINIASSYVNLIAAKEADAKVITAEVVNATDNAYEIEYVNFDAKDILKSHQLKFKIGGGTELYSLEEMRGMGYEISVSPAVSYTYSDDAKADRFKNESAETDDHIYATVNLTDKVVKEDVGLMETITYAYLVGGVEVATATATVEIVKIQRSIELSVKDIVWVYGEDAESDVTGNTLSLDAVKVEKNTVPTDTKWEQIVAAPATITVKESDAVATGVTATFGGTNSAPTLELAGFAWGKTYAIEATYELSNIDVKVTATVKTVDRAREIVKLDLTEAEKSYDIVNGLEFATEPQALTALYNGVKSYLGTMTEADYLKEVLVTKTADLYLVKNEVKGVAYANTKLNISADGLKAHATYLYSEMTATPAVVEYVYEVTTWYGQQFKITKNVTLNKPVYDIAHTGEYVAWNAATKRFESTVLPNYNPNAASAALKAFSVNDVDMNTAFYVVDKSGARVLDLATANLIIEFSTTDTDCSFTNNKLAYTSKKDFVDVDAKLYFETGVILENGEPERLQLATKFDYADVDKKEGYGTYVVNKYDPIQSLVVANQDIDANEAKTYSKNVWNYISLKDFRNGDGEYNLIVDGKWVVGNGTNGFADGKSVKDIYGLTIKYALDPASVPAGLADKIDFNTTTGELTFDNTAQIQLTQNVQLKINIAVSYPQADKTATMIVNILK